MSPTTKVPRVKFIERLHRVLAHDHPDLRWVANDKFEVAADDARARRALAAEFDFRSLSSFVRQLSYYGFKRMSDRRRSVDKSSDACVHVIFAHASGNFRRDQPESLHLITRRPRMRKPSNARQTKGRKASLQDDSDDEFSVEALARDRSTSSDPIMQQSTVTLPAHFAAPFASTMSLQRASWPGLRLPIQPAPCSWTSPYPTPVQYSPGYTDAGYATDTHTPPLEMTARTNYFPAAAASDDEHAMFPSYVAPTALLSPVSQMDLSSRRASACSMYSHASISSGAPASPAALPQAVPDYFSFQMQPHQPISPVRPHVTMSHAPDGACCKRIVSNYAPHVEIKSETRTTYASPWTAVPVPAEHQYSAQRQSIQSQFAALEQPSYYPASYAP
ncbi:hypothetical protein ACM66B_005845 [Microbotryomycetes sp. NB124-2]